MNPENATGGSRHPRIGILGTKGIPARYGGFETFAERLGEMLVAKGYPVSVYCRDETAASSYKGIELVHLQPVFAAGLARLHLPPFPLENLTRLLFDIRCLWHARKHCDVVYMLAYTSSLFCLIPRFGGREIWINMDGREWARSKWSWFGRNCLHLLEFLATRIPTRIIADAEAIRDDLAARYRRLPPCSVIAYGADEVTEAPDESLLREWSLMPDDYCVVVARIQPDNHVREIVDGFLLSGSRRKLVVVGGNTGKADYAKRLFATKDPRVLFTGGMYDREKLKALRYHAWVYGHGHSAGGTNPSLLEAMGCGNATIAHDNVFNREVAGGSALYFNTPQEVAEAINRLEADSELLNAMRTRARERVRTHYRWEDVGDAYVELLSEIETRGKISRKP